MEKLIKLLTRRYPAYHFKAGKTFRWSPLDQTIYYDKTAPGGQWSILHELGHALLNHTDYTHDIDLLKKEVQAWDKAQTLASSLSLSIPNDYLQNCLDTYRHWIAKRSSCPLCNTQGVQLSKIGYICFNCNNTWHVNSSQVCRVYRQNSIQSESITNNQHS